MMDASGLFPGVQLQQHQREGQNREGTWEGKEVGLSRSYARNLPAALQATVAEVTIPH